jgi:hypothetical protein
MDEWIKKIHNGVLFSHKKNEICHCRNMDGTGGYHVSEISHVGEIKTE